MDLKFIEQLDDTASCRAAAEDYLTCIGAADGATCTNAVLFAPRCEQLGEASIGCQTKRDFVRSAADDSRCTGKSLPPRGFLVTTYGYAPHCKSFDGNDTLSPGELMCCAYP
jgi:hypothetical protein